VKNSNETIGNRTRDFPACSAVSQKPASPRAPYQLAVSFIEGRECNVIFIGVRWTHAVCCTDVKIIMLITVSPYVLRSYLFGEISNI
jgi:hypothetical protein